MHSNLPYASSARINETSIKNCVAPALNAPRPAQPNPLVSQFCYLSDRFTKFPFLNCLLVAGPRYPHVNLVNETAIFKTLQFFFFAARSCNPFTLGRLTRQFYAHPALSRFYALRQSTRFTPPRLPKSRQPRPGALALRSLDSLFYTPGILNINRVGRIIRQSNFNIFVVLSEKNEVIAIRWDNWALYLNHCLRPFPIRYLYLFAFFRRYLSLLTIGAYRARPAYLKFLPPKHRAAAPNIAAPVPLAFRDVNARLIPMRDYFTFCALLL